MSSTPLVSIVIPTQNREKKLKRLIESLKKSTYKNTEIIIITDLENKGLANTRNRGAYKSRGRYVLFIDDDNVVALNMIEALVNTAQKNKSVIAVGPLTYYYADKNKVWFCGGKFNFTTSIPHFFTAADVDLKSDYIETQLLHNCFMVERREGEGVGWFDEYITMGGTELDMLLRIKIKFPQSKFAIATKAKCYHDIALPSSDVIRYLGFNHKKRAYYFQRNRAVMISRYGTHIQKLTFAFILYPFIFIAYSLLFLKAKKWSFFLAQSKGVLDGYAYLAKYAVQKRV